MGDGVSEAAWIQSTTALSVEAAYRAVMAAIAPLPGERLPLSQAHGRVLLESIVASEPVPSFDNSAMDGYAVRVADVATASEAAPVRLRVIGEVAAGRDPAGLKLEPGTAIRVMTGAPVPIGTEAVLMREDTRESPDEIVVLCSAEPRENVRFVGSDVAVGAVVAKAGTRLKPATLGVLASVGISEVWVHRQPRVAILATGDELAAPGSPLGPGQIRSSSTVALAALVADAGAKVIDLGIARDERDDLLAHLQRSAEADLLLTTGGVSVGDHDLVRALLSEMGEIGFWRINMQPGKPLAFGKIGGTPVMGLPGNPVSSLVSFELFARPVIRRLQGQVALRRPPIQARLADAHTKKGDRRQFLRAEVKWTDGGFVAVLAPHQGSHMLSGLAWGNALVVLPEGPGEFAANAAVEVVLLDEWEAYAGRDPDLE